MEPESPPFVIRPTPLAWEAYLSLDPTMQDECRRHAAIIAADPMRALARRRGTPLMDEQYAYRYRSDVAVGLEVLLVLTALDAVRRRAILVLIEVRGVEPPDA